MSEILTTTSQRRRPGVRRMKKFSVRTDMTPMVDLGFLLIKAGQHASYKNVIDALDEAMINVVKKYALLKAEPEELEWMKTRQ